jgi:hypothetical protein
VKPMMPWLICFIGSLLILLVFGLDHAFKAGGVLAPINSAAFLPGNPIEFSTAASRQATRDRARQFLIPSIVFTLILYGIHLIY